MHGKLVNHSVPILGKPWNQVIVNRLLHSVGFVGSSCCGLWFITNCWCYS